MSEPEAFQSILFGPWEAGDAACEPEADALADLNVDQLIERLIQGRSGYELAPLFRTPLRERWLIEYRQAVMRDVGSPEVREALDRFTDTMRQSQREIGQAASMAYDLQAWRWRLAAATTYRRAVRELHDALGRLTLSSDGMQGFRAYLADYVASEPFERFSQAIDDAWAALDAVEYAVLVDDNSVEVRAAADEPDYQADIESAFASLIDGEPVTTEARDRKDTAGLSLIEARILEYVADVFPAAFERLADFCQGPGRHIDPLVARFEREIQFYLAYRELMERLGSDGVVFCYPSLVDAKDQVVAHGVCDLALAAKQSGTGATVVANDFHFAEGERALVVTGPNQGGKTTFARSVGQIHHLAALGLPVPARYARLLHSDGVVTHFDRDEAIAEQQGRLEAELERTRSILERAGPTSLVILNELFQSTQAADAAALTRRVLAALRQRDALVVCVTFLEEVGVDDAACATMVSTRNPEDAEAPAYRVVRQAPHGRAHADTLAAQHGLTSGALARRLGR